MNKKSAKPKYLPALAEVVQRLATDLDVRIVLEEDTIHMGTHLMKTHFRTGVAKATLLQIIHECVQEDAVLLADHVPPAQAETLIAKGVQFIDASGNAFLLQKGVKVLVTGRKPVARLEREQGLGKAFSKEGLKVTFFLLTNEERLENLTVRKVQEMTGVGLGTAQYALKDLQNTGFLVKRAKQTYHLVHKKELLQKWAEVYRVKLRPKLLRGTFDARRDLLDLELKEGAAWGGEAAANKLGVGLRPGITTVYAWKQPNRIIAEGRMHKDRRGTTELLDLWFVPKLVNGKPTVPLLLVYADLITSGNSRNIEAALELEEKYHLFG